MKEVQPETASKAMTHSPLPWRPSADTDIGDAVLDANNGMVFGFGAWDVVPNETDSAFILRCVNSHEALVSALCGFMHSGSDGCFCDVAIGNPMVRDHSPACIAARAALAKAEGWNG